MVHGYRQEEGIDYDETYASVVKAVFHRMIITMAANGELQMEQLDAITAFLYGLMDKLVYVVQPTGFEDGTSRVGCKLLKPLYGLKQSPRVSYFTIQN